MPSSEDFLKLILSWKVIYIKEQISCHRRSSYCLYFSGSKNSKDNFVVGWVLLDYNALAIYLIFYYCCWFFYHFYFFWFLFCSSFYWTEFLKDGAPLSYCLSLSSTCSLPKLLNQCLQCVVLLTLITNLSLICCSTLFIVACYS